MTDKDIIKALEYCSSSDLGNCRDCPFYEQCENDERLATYTLALIYRQNNEIDMLISKKEALRDEIAQQQAEIEDLKLQIKTLLDVEKCS